MLLDPQDTSIPKPSLFQVLAERSFYLTTLHTLLIFIYLPDIPIFEDFMEIAEIYYRFSIFYFYWEEVNNWNK